jgi:membrane protein DedA with SNARE-associated domain
MLAFVGRLIGQGGASGVFLLMLIENLVPVIPSELIMPMAGFEAAAGRLGFAAAVAAGTLGSVLGALAWYALGRRLGLERLERLAVRHGRWLAMSPRELRRADGWFRRWGPLAVAVGRALPGVRGVICIPAGVARMRLAPFLLACTAGSFAWCVLLAQAGRLLRSRYAEVQAWLGPATDVFLLLCLGAYLVRVATYRARAS